MSEIQHYENFPVASWLCPPKLRGPITALYHYARTADDLADEGSASPAQRLAQLAAYRDELQHVLQAPHQAKPGSAWPRVFGALGQAIQTHRLPAEPLHRLLDAFVQDVQYTAEQRHYPDHGALLSYCERSANPVGRLLLHLYGVHDPEALAQSDAICSALQLINFWQDLGQDLARGRHYLPRDLLQAHGLSDALLQQGQLTAAQQRAAQTLVGHLCAQANQLMQQGSPLVHRLPGRAGWELKWVVQGGLRVLERLAQAQHRAWEVRPRLGKRDALPLLWRVWRM